jgi:hypothetical protein
LWGSETTPWSIWRYFLVFLFFFKRKEFYFYFLGVFLEELATLQN